jgi:hypothetical protein
MMQPLRCRCGRLRGRVEPVRPVNHAICYCKDCQAFAHFLGRADEILDPLGGTEVVQTLPSNVALTEGRSELACMRLGPKGLLRWYSRCCHTAIGNTLADPRVSFVGLVSDCLPVADPADRDDGLDAVFGPVRLRANVKSARSRVAGPNGSFAAAAVRLALMIIRARFDGRYRRTPFFDPVSRSPLVTPRVLSRSERAAITHAD